jgi:hypothetical protein
MSLPSTAMLRPYPGSCALQTSGHAVDAGGEHVGVLTELGGEAVAGVDARHVRGRTADGGAQGTVLTDKRDGASPRRNGVDRLGKGHPDHPPDRVSRPPGPARRLKLGDGNSCTCCSRRPRSSGTRTHAVTCALWTSSAAGRSTMVSTFGPLPVASAAPTVAQGPRIQTSLTGVLAAHSGVPGRPRTPNSKQAHRAPRQKIGVTGDARIIRPFSRPRRERAAAQRTRSRSAHLSRFR